MNSVVEYKILSATWKDNLEQFINDSILNGWQPLGGVSVHKIVGASGAEYSQAVVKYRL